MSEVTSNERKKRGLPKGRTNNPNGRPVGSKSKVKSPIREKIIAYVESDFDKLIKEINALPEKEQVRAKIDLIKLVVPRPLAEEEKETFNTQSALFLRLSGKD
ncbi:hypothetical protein LJC52_05420 [Bacteroidales bacterium OttesenSCG-928-A17]|nr:hypothetical protein [Bacteroidales bacterium OttesenSCG-928-A17]